jgi:hypothetical protein
MPSPRVLLLLGLPLAGCSLGVGTSVKDFEPAHTPQGVRAEINAGGAAFTGELLEVRETGLLVRTGRRLVLVPYAAIGQAQFLRAECCRLAGGRPPLSDVKRKLRLMSRFPQGLTAELRQRLLAAYGQSAPDEVRP